MSRLTNHVLVLLIALSCAAAFVPTVGAQDPAPVPTAPVPDAENATGTRGQFFHVQMDVLGDPLLEFKWTDTVKFLEFRLSDLSDQAQSLAAGGVGIRCTLEPLTETGNFLAQMAPNCPSLLAPGESTTRGIQITRTPGAGPVSASWQLNVTTTSPVEEFVGTLVITTRVEEFANLAITPGIGDRVPPDTSFDVTITLKNNGNYLGIYRGEAEVPEGWHVVIPASVAVPAGEEVDVNVSIVSPRGKIYYMSESALITLRYTNVDNPQISRTASLPVSVHGVFVPPQLIPFVVLSLALAGVFIFFAVLARRAVEEQILGKPVPPWRIPVEREYLQQLAKDDPDEYYVVRYYLMEEEHQSALLWYNAYKKATKKDRKAESKWVKLKNKQERKISKEEKAHARLEKKWDRKVLRMNKKRDRKIARLEKKLRRKERKKQKKFDKKYDKVVAKIQKKHDKKVAKAVKKHEKKVAKETKKVERQNKKLEKKGEEPLPLPDIPAPEFAEPELPERKAAAEVPLDESRYAKRAARTRKYYDWRADRRRARGDKKIAKDAKKRGIKMEKLRAKIPAEPKTHLYDSAEFVPEDEVIVEDDRPFVAKLLHLPTLEEREEEQRRRQVYRARLKEAKASDDPRKAEAVMESFAEEREARRQARKDQLALARSSALEQKRLAQERQRRIKERAKEMAREAKEEAKAGRGFRVGKKPAISEEPAAESAQPLPAKTRGRDTPDGPAEEAPAEGGRLTGLKARFKKREREAGAEEEKKERPESPEAAAGGAEDQR